VDYSLDDGATWVAPVSCTSDLKFTLKTLTNGIHYEIRVRAVNEAGEAASNSVLIKRDCPVVDPFNIGPTCMSWPTPHCPEEIPGDFDVPLISGVVAPAPGSVLSQGDKITIDFSVADESGVACSSPVEWSSGTAYLSAEFVANWEAIDGERHAGHVGGEMPLELLSGNHIDGMWRATFEFPYVPAGVSGILNIYASDHFGQSSRHVIPVIAG